MSFESVTTLTPVHEGRFTAEVSPDWTIDNKPNGGYLLALLGQAATRGAAHPHVLAASAHYLRATTPGPVDIAVETLRSGRSASQARVRLTEQNVSCVEALVTTGELRDTDAPFWARGTDRPAITPMIDCLRVPPVSPVGLPVPIMGEVDLRIDPADAGFARGVPSGRGVLNGWLALPSAADFDPLSLLYAVDAFPPPTFEISPTGWVPTLELTAYVRALPAPGPVQVRIQANLIDAQRVDETCWIWDSTGRLVAQATQLAGVRLG